MRRGIVNSNVKYDYARMMRDLSKLRNKFGIRTEIIGITFEGREIPAAVLGEGKLKLLLAGGHGGREYLTSAYLMRSLELICTISRKKLILQGMETDRLLKEKQLFFVPMLNPDGVNISIYGPDAAQYPLRIKRMRLMGPAYETWNANANGVDLNRSYPCLFDQKSTLVASSASESYKGSAPGCESEAAALMRLCDREGFCAAASFHAKGNHIVWADRNSAEKIPEAERIARDLARVSGYRLMPPSADPGCYAGGFENWFRERYVKPCLLIRLSPDTGGLIPHPMRAFDSLVWQDAQYVVPTLAYFVQILQNR